MNAVNLFSDILSLDGLASDRLANAGFPDFQVESCQVTEAFTHG
jgi:hypothetical protein